MFPVLRCLKIRVPLEGGSVSRRLKNQLWTHTGFHWVSEHTGLQ